MTKYVVAKDKAHRDRPHLDRLYYTGDHRARIQPWTPHRKQAKVYVKRGWAQRAADKLGGQVVEVTNGSSR